MKADAMNDLSGTMSAQTGAGGPTVYPATHFPAPASDNLPVKRSPWRLTTVALILTLLVGAASGGWLALRFFGETQPVVAVPNAPVAAGAATKAAPATVAVVPATIPVTASEAGAIAARVGLLEERLSRITLAAESASGNAARAEALLVAFAARRAIERGFPLGAMEAQLRLRFGETQPNAVQSILSAAADPVTSEELLQRAGALRPVLLADASDGWIARLGNGLSTLVVVRAADAPSSAPAQRHERAMRALENGRVDIAIAEIEAMPGKASPLVASWINDARRYNDARRSLDLIETAAILEPGQHRDRDTAAR
jgi:hypothetical protein